MDAIIQFVFEHAAHAHWITFGALLLGGFCLPISEDVLIVFSAVLAATVIPEHTVHLFLGIFLGCLFSDWICYWVGRTLGPKLWNLQWVAKTLDRSRLEQIRVYYEKYGFWTLVIGRLIPFGVRNCLFLTAGMGKMPFGRFMLCDTVACFVSNTALFSLSFYAGKNYQALLSFLKAFNILIFTVFVVSIICLIWYKHNLASRTKNSEPE